MKNSSILRTLLFLFAFSGLASYGKPIWLNCGSPEYSGGYKINLDEEKNLFNLILVDTAGNEFNTLQGTATFFPSQIRFSFNSSPKMALPTGGEITIDRKTLSYNYKDLLFPSNTSQGTCSIIPSPAEGNKI